MRFAAVMETNLPTSTKNVRRPLALAGKRPLATAAEGSCRNGVDEAMCRQ